MTIKQKIIINITALILLLVTVAAVGPGKTVPTAKAVVITENDYDHTKVEDDLADLDLSEYPKDANGTPKIAELVEYCYADNVFRQGNYGLYLYVYNPAQTVFSTKEGANVVNMATSYKANGEPDAWDNVSLTYLGKTTESSYEDLIYKFRVTDASKILVNATAYSKTHGQRRYDIEGLQLRSLGSGVTHDYAVGGTWRFAGYAKGYGSDTGTLDCEKTEHETLRLEVQSTFYRPEGIVNKGHQDQLNSVYFAVPKTITGKYDGLQKIKAEWQEYRTGLTAVFSNERSYNAFAPFVGKRTADISSDYVFAGNYNYLSGTISTGNFHDADYFYNLKALSGVKTEYDYTYDLLSAAYMDKDYTIAVISDDQLQNDLVTASEKLGGEKILGRYSKALFTDDLDEGHEHYNLREIDADEEYSLTSKTLNADFWYKFLGIKNYTSTVYDGIKAITEVSQADVTGSAEETADRLYIDLSDVADFKAYREKAENEDKTVYLFRFSQTDYYSTYIHDNTAEVEQTGMKTKFGSQPRGYAARQTVFLGFDIISLTFTRDGEYYVIPVVSDPIDIIGDITPPVEPPPTGCKDIQRILVIVLGVLLLVLLVFVIVKIVRLVTKNKDGQKSERKQKPKKQKPKRDKKQETSVKVKKPKRENEPKDTYEDIYYDPFADEYLDFPDDFWEDLE